MILYNALVASVAYGSWAAYANLEYGLEVWSFSAGVQGLYAFLSTLSVTAISKWIYIKNGCGNKGMVFSFCVSFLVMFSIPVLIHSAVATPNLLMTILPGLVWGACYLLAFLVVTEKNRRAHSVCLTV